MSEFTDGFRGFMASGLRHGGMNRQTGFTPRRRLRGIALHDVDTERRWDEGELISGPGSALMLAVCRRAVGFDHLTGPGVATLRARLPVAVMP